MEEYIYDTQEVVIDSKVLRDKYVGRYDILEKVKKLLLVPGTELATTKQVAEYYSTRRTIQEKLMGLADNIISEETIQKVYQRHKDEFVEDGVVLKKANDFLNWNRIPGQRGSTTMMFYNGESMIISNGGTKVFPRRAILRVGMLLTGSDVAREVRTQILNIEGKTSNETKIQDINEEQQLLLNIGIAYASGNMDAILKATSAYNAFQKRHIKKLENDNKALSSSILEWEDRSKLNAGVRKLTSTIESNFGQVWCELYKNLQYKYGICLRSRGPAPYIQYIKESEWENVIKTFCAMCEAYNVSPTDMFQQTTPKITISD